MEYIVYKISNSINNKIYFGVTQQLLKVRWQQHKCNSNKKNYHLYNAIKKYGFDNFIIEIVSIANSKEEMFSKEIKLIKKYKTNNNLFGYNNSSGGESSRFGAKLTQQQKNKISFFQKARIRQPHSKETKDKISKANKGNKMSNEQKKKLSEIKKGFPAKNKKSVILNNKEIFSSITDASLKTGTSISSIINNIKGLSKLTKTGKWEIYQVKN